MNVPYKCELLLNRHAVKKNKTMHTYKHDGRVKSAVKILVSQNLSANDKHLRKLVVAYVKKK